MIYDYDTNDEVRNLKLHIRYCENALELLAEGPERSKPWGVTIEDSIRRELAELRAVLQEYEQRRGSLGS
jgi:hypothetical protein